MPLAPIDPSIASLAFVPGGVAIAPNTSAAALPMRVV
jgi:hypothetical protein